MQLPEPFSIRRRLKSFGPAFQGLKLLIQTQHNARIHLIVGAGALALAGWLEIGRLKFILILWSVAGVWAAEALNTSCELVLNMMAVKYSVKVKRAKDIAAASVLITSAAALATGLLLLGPPLYRRFFLT